MTVIRREECPVHGVDYGVTTTIGADRWCQHCGRPANKLEMVEYVPAEQLRGTVAAIERIADIDPQARSMTPPLARLQNAVAIAMAARARYGGR